MVSPAELKTLCATDIRDHIPEDTVAAILDEPPFLHSQSGLTNHRDLGLVPGSAIKPGVVHRCAQIQDVPQSTAWIGANVTAIVDLRSARERTALPDPVVSGVQGVFHVPLDEGKKLGRDTLEAFAAGDGREAWCGAYTAMLTQYAASFRALLEHIRDDRGLVLFHCTAGRDRTGIAAGMLHTLAGTPEDVIVHDYMLTRIGIEPARGELTVHLAKLGGIDTFDKEYPPAWFINMANLRPSFYQLFVEKLREKHGGWEGYVRSLGFGDADLEKIRNNLRK